MANKRATIVISGDVQDVGFRGIVMRMAQKLELVGYVENLPDGSVRVICEGEEEAINDFVKKQDIHNGDIDVENIDVEWSEATDEFEWFEVKYSDLGAEMFQGFATAGRMLKEVGQKVDGVGKDVRVVGEKVDGVGSDIKEMHTDLKDGFNRVEGAISGMHSDMNTRFDTMKASYGEIGKDIKTVKIDMAKLTTELHNSTEALISLTQKIGALIDQKLAE